MRGPCTRVTSAMGHGPVSRRPILGRMLPAHVVRNMSRMGPNRLRSRAEASAYKTKKGISQRD